MSYHDSAGRSDTSGRHLPLSISPYDGWAVNDSTGAQLPKYTVQLQLEYMLTEDDDTPMLARGCTVFGEGPCHRFTDIDRCFFQQISAMSLVVIVKPPSMVDMELLLYQYRI